jgi:hypothetical protein
LTFTGKKTRYGNGCGCGRFFLAVCMEGSSQEYSTVIGDVNSKLNWYPPGPEIAFLRKGMTMD